MLRQKYCSEIESLLIQFIASFDDNKIVRPIKNSDQVEYILPRWIVSGKQRIFYDIVNQAGNITLPVSVVEINNLSLAKDRLFNKILSQRITYGNKEYRYKQPTPIDLSLTVNFYTKYFNDIWQMMSNFASYTNPYIFTSWQINDELLPFTEEIRCKVTWDGSFNIDYPKTIGEDKQWLITGTAGFTLEGWLFNHQPIKNEVITTVDHKLGPTSYNVQVVTDDDKIEYYSKYGWPSVTSIIVDNIRLSTKLGDTLPIINGKTMIIEGRSFFTDQCTGILIKPKDETITELPGLTPVIIDTIKLGKVNGFAITEEYISISENIIKFKIPKLPNNLIYDIIIYNNAGFLSIKTDKHFEFQAVLEQ